MEQSDTEIDMVEKTENDSIQSDIIIDDEHTTTTNSSTSSTSSIPKNKNLNNNNNASILNGISKAKSATNLTNKIINKQAVINQDVQMDNEPVLNEPVHVDK